VILGILADDDETFIPIIEDIEEYQLNNSGAALDLAMAVSKAIKNIEKDEGGEVTDEGPDEGEPDNEDE